MKGSSSKRSLFEEYSSGKPLRVEDLTDEQIMGLIKIAEEFAPKEPDPDQ